MVIDGSGSIVVGRYIKSSGTITNAHYGRANSLSGASHTIEVILLHDENRIVVTVDGRRYCNFVDSIFFSNLSTYAVWELYEQNSSYAGAQLISAWADGNDIVAKPLSFAPQLLAASPPGGYEATAAQDTASGTFTTSLVASLENITIQPSFSFIWPESLRVLVRISVWASVSGGDLLLFVNNTGGGKVAVSGFTGRVTYEVLLTGTSGQAGVSSSVQWQSFVTGGSATFTKGGSVGVMSLSAIPLK